MKKPTLKTKARLKEVSSNDREGGGLARRDIATSYHLSVILDDAQQCITNIVRGKDLFASTSVHRVLQELLGLPALLYHLRACLREAGPHVRAGDQRKAKRRAPSAARRSR